MKNVIAPGSVSSAANPLLDFWAQVPIVDGDFTYYKPAAPFALAFQIWSLKNPDAPVQVFPATPGDRQAVNLTTDNVAGVAGHYAAAWTCSVSATDKGRYQIRWFYTSTSGGLEAMVARDFDVLPAALSVPDAGDGYVLPSDMRDEGFTASIATDTQLLRRIALASRYIDRVTGRFFAPTYKTVQPRAIGSDFVDLGEPVIALASVSIGGEELAGDTFRVSNRHLSENLTNPDDRVAPSIQLWSDVVASTIFPISVYGYTSVGGAWRFPFARDRIVTLRGLFGYTEYDGTPTGRTPLLIQHAAKLIVARELPKIGSAERDDAQKRHRLTSERTRDQSYTLADPRMGDFTGDAEIDDILSMFSMPLRIGSV